MDISSNNTAWAALIFFSTKSPLLLAERRLRRSRPELGPTLPICAGSKPLVQANALRRALERQPHNHPLQKIDEKVDVELCCKHRFSPSRLHPTTESYSDPSASHRPSGTPDRIVSGTDQTMGATAKICCRFNVCNSKA